MSAFWKYFTKTLRFLPILSGGPLAILAEGGARALDAAREVALWLRDQFFPDRCDEEMMVLFASARGITKFDYETEEQYFDRIRLAYAWHQSGGREEGMLWILRDGCGIGNLEIINLRDEDPARWAEFAIRAPNITGQAMLSLPSIEWAINEVKPARSKFAEMRPELNIEPAMRRYGASGPLTGAAMYVFPIGMGLIELEKAYATRAISTFGGANTVIFPKT